MKAVKDSLIYLGGEIFAKSLPFLLLPYLTRTLGAAGYGTLSYWQTVAAFLFIVLCFNQEGALTRYFYFYGRRGMGRLVGAGYLYTAAAALLLLAAAWLAQSPVLAAVVLAAAAQSVLAVQLAVRQCQKRAFSYVLIQAASGTAVTLLTVLLLEYTAGHPVIQPFWALFAGQSAVAAAAFYFERHRLKTRFGLRALRRSFAYLAAFGAPLLLHNAGNLVKGQLDRFIAFRHFPAEQIGVYAAAFQLALIFSVLLAAVNKALLPHYFQAIKEGRVDAARVRRWALYSLAAAPLPPLAAWLVPEPAYLWVLGAQYAGARYYTCLFLAGMALAVPYLILVNHLFYYGRNRTIAAFSLLSAAAYAAALFAALPFGLRHVPLALIAGNAAILPLLYAAVRRPAAPPVRP